MTPDQGKVLCKVFLDTIQQEVEATKKVIKAVPEDKKSYKPDPKSMTAHELAWHIATAHVWFMDGVLAGQFSQDAPPAAPPTIAAILEWYETNQRDRANKLKDIAADNLVKTISFFGLMELPAVLYLNFQNLHTAHHRGQLSTYLRPMGSKVPAIYGGSADEPMGGA